MLSTSAWMVTISPQLVESQFSSPQTEKAFFVFIYVFLLIFVATALLTVLAIPGWIKIDEPYRKRLFTALILEVIGAVVGFVTVGMRIVMPPSNPTVTAAQLRDNGAWLWESAVAGWHSHGRFAASSKGVSFSGVTRFVGPGGDIFYWSGGAVAIDNAGQAITFVADQVVVDDIKDIMGERAPKPGKNKVRFDLHPVRALAGTWTVVADKDRNMPNFFGDIGCLKLEP